DLKEEDERLGDVSGHERGYMWTRWAFVVLLVARFVGDVTMPATVERFPLLLILLSPRWRMILLVSTRLAPGLLIPFALVRCLLTIVVVHQVGRHGIRRGRLRSPARTARGRPQRLKRWFKRSSATLL